MEPIQMVDLQRQYLRDQSAFDSAMAEVIASGAFVNGPAVKAFSSDLSSFLDGAHVIPCANGTDALQIALMALDLQPGDEVITVPFTFVATVEVVALLGLKPVFVDIQPDTFNLDPAQLEAAITPRTKAIIPVHLYGQCCDMDPILEIACRHGIAVIEDTAQALGASYRSAHSGWTAAGTMGLIGTTSFYPTKNLGCWGDGGALFTRDAQMASRLQTLCNHGSDRKYYYDAVGVNSRLDSLQAAVLSVKLRHLGEYMERRRELANRYDGFFCQLPDVTLPHRAAYSTHVFHQYTLKVEQGRRDELRSYLEHHGIPCMIYYPVPLHLSAAYRSYGYSEGDFPVAEQMAHQVLSLPMHTELDHEQYNHITQTIGAYFDLPR